MDTRGGEGVNLHGMFLSGRGGVKPECPPLLVGRLPGGWMDGPVRRTQLPPASPTPHGRERAAGGTREDPPDGRGPPALSAPTHVVLGLLVGAGGQQSPHDLEMTLPAGPVEGRVSALRSDEGGVRR